MSPVRERVAAWIDAVGEYLVRLAAKCFEAAYRLDPELLEEHHASTAMAARVTDALMARHTAVQIVEATNAPLYVAPPSAVRHYLN